MLEQYTQITMRVQQILTSEDFLKSTAAQVSPGMLEIKPIVKFYGVPLGHQPHSIVVVLKVRTQLDLKYSDLTHLNMVM